MSEIAPVRFEARWPAILTIFVVLTILEFLPGRLRVAPFWFPYVAALILVAPMIGEQLTHSALLARVERVDIYVFALISIVLMIWTIGRLVYTILTSHTEMGGIELLASAVALWIINIFAFALLYWEIDRGGPDRRAAHHESAPEILFPELPAGASYPFTFIDYLFFSFTTSTAFSPTETYPITPRMKALMMIQSTISLLLIVIVGARAINVLK